MLLFIVESFFWFLPLTITIIVISLLSFLMNIVNWMKNKYYPLPSSCQYWSYLSTPTVGPVHKPSPPKGRGNTCYIYFLCAGAITTSFTCFDRVQHTVQHARDGTTVQGIYWCILTCRYHFSCFHTWFQNVTDDFPKEYLTKGVGGIYFLSHVHSKFVGIFPQVTGSLGMFSRSSFLEWALNSSSCRNIYTGSGCAWYDHDNWSVD